MSDVSTESETGSKKRSLSDILENVRITEKHRLFLRCIWDFDGRVPMSKIKDRTGLSQDEANSRFLKWSSEEFDLIDVEKLSAEESGKPTGERVAVLNERGKQAIQQGLIGDVFDEDEKEVRRVFGTEEVEDFEEMKEDMERMKNIVSRFQEEVTAPDTQSTETVDDLNTEIESLESDFLKMMDKLKHIESEVGRIKSDSGLEELDGVKSRVQVVEGQVDELHDEIAEVRDDFESFSESAKEHLLNAEAYMKGTRWALEDNLDEDLNIGKYVSKVRDTQSS